MGDGIEWNVRIQANESNQTRQICQSFADTFDRYWNQEDLRFKDKLIEYSDNIYNDLQWNHIQESLEDIGIIKQSLKTVNAMDPDNDPQLIEAAKALHQVQKAFQQAQENFTEAYRIKE